MLLEWVAIGGGGVEKSLWICCKIPGGILVLLENK